MLQTGLFMVPFFCSTSNDNSTLLVMSLLTVRLGRGEKERDLEKKLADFLLFFWCVLKITLHLA